LLDFSTAPKLIPLPLNRDVTASSPLVSNAHAQERPIVASTTMEEARQEHRSSVRPSPVSSSAYKSSKTRIMCHAPLSSTTPTPINTRALLHLPSQDRQEAHTSTLLIHRCIQVCYCPDPSHRAHLPLSADSVSSPPDCWAHLPVSIAPRHLTQFDMVLVLARSRRLLPLPLPTCSDSRTHNPHLSFPRCCQSNPFRPDFDIDFDIVLPQVGHLRSTWADL
jgi:hypothetical protein